LRDSLHDVFRRFGGETTACIIIFFLFFFLFFFVLFLFFYYYYYYYYYHYYGATARGGPWPPLQYVSKPLDPLLYLSIRLFPSYSGP
jgi:hypothetical protein